MADDLTVRTGTGEGLPGTEVSGAKALDKGRDELDKLRDLAKTRHGRHLDDKTLAAIAARRKAKIAHEKRVTDTKSAFETTQGRESVTSKAADHETRAQKAAGTAETRGAEGLTEQERTSIRSDPKAAPKLPPADTKATTPEQASGLLERMSSLLVSDGKPFDLEAYAKSLKSKPPSEPAQTKAPAGKTQAQAPALARQAAAMSARPAGGEPRALPREGSAPAAALGPPVASAKLGLRATQSDTSLSRTGAANSGLFNAGGGLITGTRFDGMSFNWDAFFSLFLIRSREDLHIWRRFMNELDAAAREVSLQGRDLQMALTKMRQAFGRVDANVKFQESMHNVSRQLQRAPVYEILGQNPDKVPGIRQELAKTVGEIYDKAGNKAAPYRGRLGLSDAELDALNATPEQKAAYKKQRGALSLFGGDLADLSLLMDDRARVRADQAEMQKQRGGLPPAEKQTPQQQQELRDIDARLRELSSIDAQLGQAIDTTRATIGRSAAKAMAEPEVAAYLNDRRGSLARAVGKAVEKVRKEQARLLGLLSNPSTSAAERAKIPEKQREARAQEASLLLQIVVLDSAMAGHESASPELKDDFDKLVKQAQVDLAKANQRQSEYTAEAQKLLADDPKESNELRRARLEGRLADLKAEGSRLRAARAGATGDRDQRDLDLQSLVNERLQGVNAKEIEESKADSPDAQYRTERLNRARQSLTVPAEIQDRISSAAARADRLHHLIHGEGDHQTGAEGAAGPAGAHVDLVNVWARDDSSYRQRLSAAVDVGNEVAHVRARHLPDPDADKRHSGLRSAIRGAGEGPMVGAVDSAVQNAIAAAGRERKELDAAMTRHVQQAQGMINQLIQLLGMSRTR